MAMGVRARDAQTSTTALKCAVLACSKTNTRLMAHFSAARRAGHVDQLVQKVLEPNIGGHGRAAAAERALASAVAKQRQVARRASVAAHHVAALAVLDARQERRHLIKRIKECPASLQSAPLALLRDDGFLLDCVRHCPEALSYVPRPRYDDKDFLVKAVQVSEARAFRHGRRRWVVSKLNQQPPLAWSPGISRRSCTFARSA